MTDFWANSAGRRLGPTVKFRAFPISEDLEQV